MEDFFKQWRRKIGLMTLLLACLLTAAWGRGHKTTDIITFEFEGGVSHCFHTSRDGLMWERYSARARSVDQGIHWFQYPVKYSGRVFPFEEQEWLLINQLSSRRQLLGFDFGEWRERIHADYGVIYFIVPYWSIILPLTLLSTRLILTKCCQPKVTQSVSEPES